MDNSESIIFTKTFIKSLQVEGYFDEETNPFMDEDVLYEEVLKHSSNNLLVFNQPQITEEQFEESVKTVRMSLINDTFNDMVDKGMIEPSGMDSDGELLYSLGEGFFNGKKKKSKKNKPKS